MLYSGEHPDRMSSRSLTLENDGGRPVLHTQEAGSYEVTFANGQIKRVNCRTRHRHSNLQSMVTCFSAQMGRAISASTRQSSIVDRIDRRRRSLFSGTAIYRTTVNVTNSQLAERNSFGSISARYMKWPPSGSTASLLQSYWKAPYCFRADPLLHPGENTIEVDVTNLWPNRLIGDAQSSNGKHLHLDQYPKVHQGLSAVAVGPAWVR